LFWKFFLSILLAQLAATVGIGGAVWLKNRNQLSGQQSASIPARRRKWPSMRPPRRWNWRREGLQRMLENMERHRVYAVDEQGHELLGRIVNPRILEESRARQGRRQAPRGAPGDGDDGKHYLLFLPSGEHMRTLEAKPVRCWPAWAAAPRWP
jgi:hypothetical protein